MYLFLKWSFYPSVIRLWWSSRSLIISCNDIVASWPVCCLVQLIFFHKLMPCCHAAMVVAAVLAGHGHGFLSVVNIECRQRPRAACNPMSRQIARHCWGLGGRRWIAGERRRHDGAARSWTGPGDGRVTVETLMYRKEKTSIFFFWNWNVDLWRAI